MQIRFSPEALTQLTNVVRSTQQGGNQQQGSGAALLNSGPNLGQKNLTQASNLPPLPSAAGGIEFQAMVIAADGKGQVTLSLHNGLKINVQTSEPLPVGTQVTLGLKSNGEVQVLGVNLPAADAKAALMSKMELRWENLLTALTRLSTQDPTTAAKILQPLPSIAKGLLPGLVQFMNAVKGASLEELFSPQALEVLRSVGMEGPLRQDLQQMHALHQKADLENTWRSYFFPYIEDNQDQNPKQGSFFWRSETESDEPQHRFVLNMALSQLGPIQLDGLVKQKTLYLKLRSQQDLGPEVAQGLQTVVTTTLNALGWQGGAKIEHSPRFSVDPLAEMTQTPHTFNVEV